MEQDSYREIERLKSKKGAPVDVYEELAVNNEYPFLAILRSVNSSQFKAGNTVWHHICAYNNKLAMLLLQNDMFIQQLNFKNEQNLSPLDVACMFCSYQIVELMVSKGAKGYIAYWSARGGSDFITYQNDYSDHLGNSAVHYSAENDLIESLKAIHRLKGSAELQRPNARGLTPLSLSLTRMSYRCSEYLIKLLGVGYLSEHQNQLIQNIESNYLKELYDKEKAAAKAREGHLRPSREFASALRPFMPYLLLIFTQFAILPAMVQSSPIVICAALLLLCHIEMYRRAKKPLERLPGQTNRRLTFKSQFFGCMIGWGSRHRVYLAFLGIFAVQIWLCLHVKQEGWYMAGLTLLGYPVLLVNAVHLSVHVLCVAGSITPIQLVSITECSYLMNENQVDYKGFVSKKLKLGTGEGRSLGQNLEEYMKY